MHIVVGSILVSKFKHSNKYRHIDKYHYTDKYRESRSAEALSAHFHILLLYTYASKLFFIHFFISATCSKSIALQHMISSVQVDSTTLIMSQ